MRGFGDQRRLDGDGAAAAEGVAEIVPAPVAGELDHGGGHGLLERRRVVRRAVTPLVQPFAGGVDAERNAVLHDGKLNLIQRASLREPLQVVDAFQPFHDGLLDDLLAVGDGEERGVETVSLDGKHRVAGQYGLPGQSLGAFKELVKGFRLKAAELDQDPLADAQAEVGAGKLRIAARKVNTPVFRGDIRNVQAFEFIGNRPLQPKQAGHTHLIFHRNSHFQNSF